MLAMFCILNLTWALGPYAHTFYDQVQNTEYLYVKATTTFLVMYNIHTEKKIHFLEVLKYKWETVNHAEIQLTFDHTGI